MLKDVDDISFNFFTARDVVRHRLVQRVVKAYEAFEELNKDAKGGQSGPRG